MTARTSTPLPMSVTDAATFSLQPRKSRLCAIRAATLPPRGTAMAAKRHWLRDGELPQDPAYPIVIAGARWPGGARAYLIFVSLKATCLRATGSYFLKRELLGRGPRVLLRDVEEPGAGRAQQLDLLGNRLGHGVSALIGCGAQLELARTLVR